MIFLNDNDNDNDDNNSFHCLELNSANSYSQFFHTNPSSLKIFHNNIRSYSKHIDEFLIYFELFKTNLDIIIFSECWLGHEVGEGTPIDGFDIHMTTTQRNRSDGVIVYTNKALSATSRQIVLGDVYGISLNFSYNNRYFDLLAIYRTFDSNPQRLAADIGEYYNQIDKNKMCIFMGDININLLEQDILTEVYLNSLLGAGLISAWINILESHKIVIHALIMYLYVTMT
jgi:hypothetical protein